MKYFCPARTVLASIEMIYKLDINSSHMENSTKDENEGVQESFDITLQDTNLGNLAFDITELAIDNVLKEGILKDIPVINSFVSLAKFGASVHDKLFAKKILAFLIGLKDISIGERKRMISEIDISKKHRLKVGEKLLYIIDSCNDYENTERVAIVFKAFVEGKISYDDFLECASILGKITTRDFKWFLNHGKGYLRIEDVGSLTTTGLFDLSVEPVDVQVREKEDIMERFRMKMPNNPTYPKKDKEYEAEVDGGGINLSLSNAGKIIMNLFHSESRKG